VQERTTELVPAINALVRELPLIDAIERLTLALDDTEARDARDTGASWKVPYLVERVLLPAPGTMEQSSDIGFHQSNLRPVEAWRSACALDRRSLSTDSFPQYGQCRFPPVFALEKR